MFDYTGNDWQLFTHSMDCSEATHALNRALEKFVEEATIMLDMGNLPCKLTAAEWVRDRMYKVMDTYSNYGAADTEPECFLVSELEEIFKLDKYGLTR